MIHLSQWIGAKMCCNTVAVTQNDRPSQEQIDSLHSQFCASIQAVFDNHKHLLGEDWAKKELQIV
jgi:hypothetical protein